MSPTTGSNALAASTGVSGCRARRARARSAPSCARAAGRTAARAAAWSRDRASRPTSSRASAASAASSSSSSCARSRSRRGSTSATSALAGSRSGSRCSSARQPRQPRLHAVERLPLGEALPLLASPTVASAAARRARRAPRRSASSSRTGKIHASSTSPVERWSATENCDSRSTSSPHRSMRTGWSAVDGIHVDDRAAHRDLAARLHLVLAPVAHRDELLDELVAVELRAGPRRRRLDSSTCGPSRCTSARTGATTTAGRWSPPARRRQMTRRRRPIVSIAGDTRSNGSVSHAGNSSTASAPRNSRRSAASRSASTPVGTASTTGRRAVARRERRARTARAPVRGPRPRAPDPPVAAATIGIVAEQRGEPGEGGDVGHVGQRGDTRDAVATRGYEVRLSSARYRFPRWRSLPEQRREGTVLLRDGRALGFAEWGNENGAPVVAFHGAPGSRHLALGCEDAAADAGLRLLCLERPGFGLSDPEPERTLISWADDVADADACARHRELYGGRDVGRRAVPRSPALLACPP